MLIEDAVEKAGKRMNRAIFTLIAGAMFATALHAGPLRAETRGLYEVIGVEDDDMLKMRAGPGVGYRIVVGLPNGTALWVQGCEPSGNTSWCRVSLKQARGLKGYVSGAYLRKQ